MASEQTAIVERPGRTNPADLANKIAVLSWYPGLTTSPVEILYAQRLSDVATLGLRGKGADIGAFALRNADERNNPCTVYFVPMPATVAGSIVDNGSSGFGPTQTLIATNSHPYDDAIVKVRIRESGIPGVGTFEISTAYSITRDADGGNPSIDPLYSSPQNIPPETTAYLVGNVDITGLTFAGPAIVTGNIDIVNSTTLYGSGGTLAGKIFDIDIDGAATITITFGVGINAPSSYASVISKIQTDIGSAGVVSVTNNGYLRITGVDVSAAAGEIILAAGSPDALALLGLSAATTTGTNGALDGLTLIYQGDATSGSQTWTIPSGSSAYASYAAFVAALTARTGVDASLYSAANYLRVGSSTAGSLSTFQVTGGTGLTALGLSIASATGAASEYVIAHLGIKITFPQGTYSAGYTRTWTVKAPSHSIAAVQTAIAAMVAQDIRVGRVVCPSEIPIDQVAPFIQGMSATIGTLESANDARFMHGAFGAPIAESDTSVKLAMVSGVGGDINVGRRVDMAARTAYVRPARSSPNNTGSLLRSQLWPLVAQYGGLPLGSDVGQHNTGIVSYVDWVPVDEDAATVKLSALRDDTPDPRAMTLQKWGNGYYFTAGFTLAPSASAYADQYTRDITLRVAQLIHAALQIFLNDPTLATDPSTGKLTAEGAGSVASTGLASLSSLLAPKGAPADIKRTFPLTSATVAPDRNEVIAGPSGTQQLKVDVNFSVNGVARKIRITVGAGLLTVEEG